MSYKIITEDLGSYLKDESVNLTGKYYAEYYGSKFQDVSFIVLDEKGVAGVVFCHVINSELSFNTEPVKVYLYRDCTNLIEQCISILFDVAKKFSCAAILVEDQYSKGNLSSLGKALYKKSFKPSSSMKYLIDFSDFDEIKFKKDLRKSYKSLINWGLKNFKTEIISAESYDHKKIKICREFHRKISGFYSRNLQSWNIQGELIKNGYGEMVLCYFQDKLMGASIFLDTYNETSYATGVYDRNYFNMGISHFSIFLGIIRSQKRNPGGYINLARDDFKDKSEKEKSILFFKKGFCEAPYINIEWKLMC